jgi:hypothetical protein
MKIDGKRSGISPRSRRGQRNKDGKKGPDQLPARRKSTAKYTIVRKPQDIEQLDKLRRILKDIHGPGRYNTDAEIYRDFPQLFFNAVKESQDLQLANEELTAKLDQLEDLRASVCRILEICKVKK